MPVATAQTELSVLDRKHTKGLKRGIAAVKAFGRKVGSVMKTTAIAFAGLGVAAGAIAVKFLKSFAAAEESQGRLAAVVKATGMAAGFTADQMAEMADSLQTITGQSDEVIKDGMAILATFKEIKGDEFKDATVAMLDMAAVLQTDAKTAAIQLGKALNDPIKGVTALSRSGVSFTEQQKEQIKTMQESGNIMGAQRLILNELQSEFGGAAEALGDTFGGRVSEVMQRLGDLGEEIGEALMPTMDFLIEKIGLLAGFIEDNMDTIQAWIKVFGEVGQMVGTWLANKLVSFVETGIKVFTFFETAIKNWENTVRLITSSVLLTFVKLGGWLTHFFTETFPANLKFMIRVWIDGITLIPRLYISVFTNILKNAKDFFKSLINVIKGKPADFKFTNLLKGFQIVTAKIGQVAERVPSKLEEALERQMAIAGANLGTAVAEKAEERIRILRRAIEDIGMGLSREERKRRAKKALEDITAVDVRRGRPETPSEKKKGVKAQFEGLADSWRRITKAASATDPSKQDIKKTATATEKTATATEKIAKTSEKTLEAIRKLPREGFVSAELAFGV